MDASLSTEAGGHEPPSSQRPDAGTRPTGTEIHFSKKDFRVEWFSGKGAGGQHRNKHQNCCRITHIESGLTTSGQNHRERPANQRDAFQKLARILVARYCDQDAPQRRVDGARVRTYHAGRNQVIDHASGMIQAYARVVGKADLGSLIDARRAAMAASGTSRVPAGASPPPMT